MFTGIIECLGKIKSISVNGSNKTFWIESDISTLLNIDESVSHDGVCLTIEDIKENAYKVTAIKETLVNTTFSANMGRTYEVAIEFIGTDSYKQTITFARGEKSIEIYKKLE